MFKKIKKIFSRKKKSNWSSGEKYDSVRRIQCNRDFSEIKDLYKIPICFDSHTKRNHFKMWILCNDITTQYFEHNIDCSNSFDFRNFNTISFYERKEADKFMEWWRLYTNRFDNAGYMNYTYPALKTSQKVEGWFVDSSSKKYKDTDIEKYSDLIQILFTMDDELDFEFAYILKNCKNKAYYCDHGWLFMDEHDALFFKLFVV